ncbi:helix-turn-helix domain-containing protein [Streptomyces cyaneogriseus]|jgi:transcriptional regulator with XRE-family HTH domain|uniref:helix-turn-helix domain-containing protein n=1 Tax=Streptomyces cyaneogriseus TaxID=68192 RepID=UPI00099C5C3B|nr:helix-turn-helix domain-containing protein [Streptomyces cyaneogriseus]
MAQAPTTFEVDGAAICKKRMSAGMEVQQLAAKAGITASYLRKLERGARTRMKPATYVRLRAALKANQTELLAPHPDPPERK